MFRRPSTLCGLALLVGHLAAAAVSAVDFNSFQADSDADKWLRENSATYARLAESITSCQDLRGYRFASKDDVRRGLVVWVDRYLEIQLNTQLAAADRLTTLIFEMANASRHRDHQQVDLAVDRGLIRTQEEFGLAHEMIEFEALRLHREVLVELDARAGPLPTAFYYFVTPTPAAIKDYQLPELYPYLKAQKESGHTGHYYKFFHLRNSAREQAAGVSEPTSAR